MQFLKLFCFCFTWGKIEILPTDDLDCEIPEWDVNVELAGLPEGSKRPSTCVQQRQ